MIQFWHFPHIPQISVECSKYNFCFRSSQKALESFTWEYWRCYCSQTYLSSLSNVFSVLSLPCYFFLFSFPFIKDYYSREKLQHSLRISAWMERVRHMGSSDLSRGSEVRLLVRPSLTIFLLVFMQVIYGQILFPLHSQRFSRWSVPLDRRKDYFTNSDDSAFIVATLSLCEGQTL